MRRSWIAVCLLLLSVIALRAAVPDPVDLQWKRRITGELPKNRKGGANIEKSPGVNDACLFFVAPKSTGLTTQELPAVYWYVSQPARSIVFTLVKFDTKKTVLQLELADVKPGFHKLDLAAESKTHNVKALETNPWSPDSKEDPKLDTLYRMALTSKDLQLAAVSFIARVKAPQGVTADKIDFTLAVKNELWFDAVHSLCLNLGNDPKDPARKQLGSLLLAEEVLRTEVSAAADDAQKAKAKAEEEKVLKQLSVPDPIDLQSDTWRAAAEN